MLKKKKKKKVLEERDQRTDLGKSAAELEDWLQSYYSLRLFGLCWSEWPESKFDPTDQKGDCTEHWRKAQGSILLPTWYRTNPPFNITRWPDIDAATSTMWGGSSASYWIIGQILRLDASIQLCISINLHLENTNGILVHPRHHLFNPFILILRVQSQLDPG